ncbi:MAG: DUF11 domain-containing protein [Clostridia bacterium]|nr:DUF11 domain-containing protein [Clostridia bacterium]
MKRLLAAIISLMIVLSVFAACGDKNTPAENNNADTAQSSGEAVNVPAPTDDEDGDKEATETVAETGEVTVPPSGGETTPDTLSSGDTAPSQQQGAVSIAPEAQDPAPSSGSQSTAPASSAVKPTNADDGKYSIYLFGDAVLNVHSPFDIFYSMATLTGHDITSSHSTSNNLGSTSTYSLYELCNMTGTTVNSLKSKKFNEKISSKLDCLILLSSRDRAMMSNNNPDKILSAFDYIQKTYYKANPNGKIILFVPMPYMNTNGEHAEKFEIKGITPEEHSKRIKDFAAKTAAMATGKITQLQIGDAYDYFNRYYASEGLPLYEDSGIYQSIPGAYYISCLLYAAIFDESPCGIEEYGFLDKATATTIQNAAHRFYFGTEPPASVKRASPVLHTTYQECDPRTMKERDSYYKNEKYPEYFDELLATAYFYEAAGGAVQYDQLKISKATGATLRTHQGINPAEITPQRLSYLDCTWFVHSVFKSAFGYTLKTQPSDRVIDKTEGEVFRWIGPMPHTTPEAAIELFKETLQPGDIIMYFNRDAGQGHGMLYLGNGTLIHCSGGSHKAGGSADYNYALKLDCKEPLGGVVYAKVSMLYDDAGGGGYYCFNDKNEVLILRPLSLGLKPTADAVTRAKNLPGIVCWKLSSATAGATVNPGDDVTFTYVLRNDNNTEKKVTITDKLPAHTTFKSGDVKFESGALNTTVSIPSGKTVKLSFTVTVDKDAQTGKIPCADTTIGGVTLWDYCPIYVARTLTPDEQAKITAANVTAATDNELITKTYAEIGKTVNLLSGRKLIDSVYTVASDGKSIMIGNGENRHLVVQNLYGGRYNPDTDPGRLRHIGVENITCGDVLGLMTGPDKVQLFLCTAPGVFKTVEGGKVRTYTPGNSAILLEQLFGEFGFFVLRPSFDF